ncbi:MAG TPA: hypothetical protein VHT97_15510 [Acidimicrobiales bacterium]|jgi:hypothetical protein|nr:hypothetical protein [Acidimicrobiales bacterium]
MLSNRLAPAGEAPPDVAVAPARPQVWHAVLAFVGVAAVLFVVMAHLSPRVPTPPMTPLNPPFVGPSWLRGWAQWDSGWYYRIASDGYSFAGRHQSTVAFFPVYPLLVRAVAVVVRNVWVAGIVVTFAAGAAAAGLLMAWLRDRMSPAAAWTALAVVFLYPYAFFLYGVVYPDAVFLVTVVAAFLLLESDHPVLAGLVGALATAARPVGVVLVVALAVRTVERRGALRPAAGRFVDWSRLRRADAGVLLSVLGFLAWCLFLWHRFGDPLAFATAEAGWQQSPGPNTWLKVRFFQDMAHIWNLRWWGVFYVSHSVLTIVAACLIPRVFRRFGVGYGVYVSVLIGLSAVSTMNFFGMARYLLAAFPCFAVLGEMLAERPALRSTALTAGGLGLVAFTAIFGTGYYMS